MGIIERKRKLQEKISKMQEELNRLENNQKSSVVPIEKYTVEDKIKYFDKTYEFAKSMLEEVEKNSYLREDNEHYAFEHVVEILNIENKKSIWDYWNSLQ